MYIIRGKSGSSLKGRHFEIAILPVTWKPPHQRWRHGRTCSPIWDRERNPAHHYGKKHLVIFQPVYPRQSQRSNPTASAWLELSLWTGEQPSDRLWEEVGLLNFAKSF